MNTSSNFAAKESQSRSFIYDNCIIRAHEDSDVSSSSVFSWNRSETIETSSFSETSEEENGEPEEDLSHLKVSVKESFILMLGFLNKIEKYFTENKELNEELKLLELVLINSAESFGYNVRGARNNGEVGSKAKTSKKARKSDTPLQQTQAENMNKSAETSGGSAEIPRRKSTRLQNAEKNAINNEEDAVGTKRQNRQLLKRKSKNSPSEDNRRVSKRVKREVNRDRLLNVASKIRQTLSPVERVSTTGSLNSKLIAKDKSGDSRKMSESPAKSRPTVGEEMFKETQKQPNLSTKSRKRKLYSSETWLDTLSSTAVP